jgi:hypothetical protein
MGGWARVVRAYTAVLLWMGVALCRAGAFTALLSIPVGCDRSSTLATPSTSGSTATPSTATTDSTARPSTQPAIPPLLPGESPPRDTPDYFDSAELDSGAIVTAIESCRQGATNTDPALAQQTALLENYCQCTVDAMRKNKGKAELDPTKHVPTWAQLQRCAGFAKSLPGPDARTPFGISSYDGSAVVANLYFGCERREGTQARTVRNRIAYCSCYVDAMRSHKERPIVTPQEIALCERLATHAEQSRQHLTHRQFAALADAMRAEGAARNSYKAEE